MFAIALLLAVQAVPQSMITAADDASQVYVQCLFATARAANGEQLTVESFERRLASSCLAEEQSLVRASAALFARRGEVNAASQAREMTAEARRSILGTYRQTLELQR